MRSAMLQNVIFNGTGFSPLSISGLRLWINTDSVSYADGTTLSSFLNLAGSPNLTQPTSGNQPIYKKFAYNTHSAIRIIASANQYMTANSLSSYFTGSDKPYTIFVTVKPSSVDSVRGIISMANSSVANSLNELDIGGAWRIVRRDDSGVSKLISGGTPDTSLHILSNTFNGTIGNLYLDKVLIGTANADMDVGTISINTIALGTRVSTTVANFMNGDIFEVLIYDSSLSNANRQLVENYMLDRINSTVNTYPSYDYQILTYGDSKTAEGLYQPTLTVGLNTSVPANWAETARIAVSGITTATASTTITTNLNSLNQGVSPKYILYNLGANDVVSLPSQATWTANTGTILDAMHSKYPNALIYLMRPWRRTYDSQCDSLASWIDIVISTRSSYCFVGPDERIFLKGSDNGATYTTDGIHPTVAGYALTGNQWKTSLGY